MKMYRSILGILALCGFILCTNKYIDNKSLSDTSFYQDNGVLVADLSNTSGDVLTYKNTNSYTVNLNEGTISLICKGIGSNKEDDEKLVKNNLDVSVLYSKDKENKTKEIKLLKNEIVYIYVSTNYVGDIYPDNEVNCDYSINIETSI